jgi:hypothetical protein
MGNRYIHSTLIIIIGILLVLGTTQGIWAEESDSSEIIELESIEEVGEDETPELESIEEVEESETLLPLQLVATESSPSSNSSSDGIMLNAGWNLIATPRTLDKSANTAKIFSDVDAQGHSIWTYDNEKGGWIDLTQDDVIRPLQGYWIHSAQGQWIPLVYNRDPLVVPPSRKLEQGWNLVGLSGVHDATARDAFLSVRKIWTNIIGWDREKQSYGASILNGGDGGSNEMTVLSTGHAYWVFTTDSGIMAALDA